MVGIFGGSAIKKNKKALKKLRREDLKTGGRAIRDIKNPIRTMSVFDSKTCPTCGKTAGTNVLCPTCAVGLT